MSLAVVLSVSAAACGGDSGSTTVPATLDVPAPDGTTTDSAPPDTSAALPPERLGDRIGEVYTEAIEDVVASLAGRPDAATALTELQTLKESHVQTLVALGHEREALDTAGRRAVDAQIGLALTTIPTDVFEAYLQAEADYRAVDPAVADLIASFNVITQYASFDLLRQQEPEEAARVLGE